MADEQNETKKDEESKDKSINNDTGSINKSNSYFDQINALKKGLDESTKKAQDILTRNEELYTRMALGGQSDGGEQIQVKKEETPEEYHKRFLAGEVKTN